MSQIAIWSPFAFHVPSYVLPTLPLFCPGDHVGPRKSAAPGASMVPKAAPKVPQAKAVARAVPGDDSDVDAWQWEVLCMWKNMSNQSSPRNSDHNN